jgi:hypothetical protein
VSATGPIRRGRVAMVALACAALAIAGAVPAAAAPARFGAIAVDRASGARGVSWDYPSRVAAETRAVSECGRRGCRPVVWFRDGCGAVATNGSRLAWGVAPTKGRARALARKACDRSGCRVIAWGCTSR